MFTFRYDLVLRIKGLTLCLQSVNRVFNFIVRVVVIYSVHFETFCFPVKEAAHHCSGVQVTVTEWVRGLTVLCVLQEPAASILTVEECSRSDSIKFICVVAWTNPASLFLCHFYSLAVGVSDLVWGPLVFSRFVLCTSQHVSSLNMEAAGSSEAYLPTELPMTSRSGESWFFWREWENRETETVVLYCELARR